MSVIQPIVDASLPNSERGSYGSSCLAKWRRSSWSDASIRTFVVALILVMLSPVLGQEREVTLDKKGMQDAWDAYAKFAKKLRGKIIGRTGVGKSEPTDIESICEIKTSNEFAFVSTKATKVRDPNANVLSRTLSVTSKYAFELRLPPNSSEWVLIQVERIKKTELIASLNEQINGLLVTILDGRPLAHWFRDSNFRFVKATRPNPDESKVKIYFEIDHQKGWALLDPKNYWCVDAYELDKADGWNWRGDHYYRLSPSGFPLYAKSIHAQTKGPETGLVVVGEFALEEHDGLPESEFSLSHFGFPEPPGYEVVQKGKQWWLAIIIVAVALIAAGVFLKRRKTEKG